MKKLFLVIIFLFFVLSEGFSQNIRYGLAGGINQCELLGPNKPTSYNKVLGFSAGLFTDIRFEKHTSTQINLQFSRYYFRFFNKIENLTNAHFNVKETNDYISLPVVIKYKRGTDVTFSYFSAGLQTSVLINSNRSVNATSRNLGIDGKTYYSYKNNWYDYGIVGNIGFQFMPITLNFSYYYSMRNLYTKEGAWEMRYGIPSLSLSWQINYKKPHPHDISW